MKIPLWWRRADFVRAIDGDTIECVVDLGYGVNVHGKNAIVRLLGINTPELNSTDPTLRGKALAARDRLNQLLEGRRIMLQTFKDAREKYGRYLADVHRIRLADAQAVEVEEESVNQIMLREGLGVPA